MGTTREGRLHTTEASPWMRPFVPPRFLRSGPLQTIIGNVLPRTYSLPEPESQLIEVEPPPAAEPVSFCVTAIGSPPRSAANGRQ